MNFFAQVSPQTVEQASSSLIKDTALGAFALVCMVLTVWAVLQMKKAMEERVLDKEKWADKMEVSNAADRASVALLEKSLAALAVTQAQTTVALERNTAELEKFRVAAEGMMLELQIRRKTGASGNYPVTPPRRST